MSLFNRNPNESAYVGGKKHWTDVIKNSGNGELLIWKQPEEDFNTRSTLTVTPGESAIFINNGKIEAVFSQPNRYELTTQNYPFISRLRNAFSGGISTFHCMVYFVRTAITKEMLWGTSPRIQIRDKQWDMVVDVGARGSVSMVVSDPAIFLTELVGNNTAFQTQDEIMKYFEMKIQSKVVSALTDYLDGWPQELIGLQKKLDEISAQIRPILDSLFSQFGLSCRLFSVANLDINTEKYSKRDDATIQKQQMDVLGEDWGAATQAEILKKQAENGKSVMFGGEGLFKGLHKSDKTDSPEAIAAAIQQLKLLLDRGALTQQKYDKKVDELLKRM